MTEEHNSRKPLPKILGSETLSQSRIFQIENVSLEFSNGERREFECIGARNRGAVIIAAFPEPETFLLIREYALGLENYQLGFPKGVIDAGESPEQAANRELQEEAGYGAHKLTALRKVATSPNYFRTQLDIVVAEDLYEHRLQGDEPEPLEVVPWSIHNVKALLASPEFADARNIATLALLKSLYGIPVEF